MSNNSMRDYRGMVINANTMHPYYSVLNEMCSVKTCISSGSVCNILLDLHSKGVVKHKWCNATLQSFRLMILIM